MRQALRKDGKRLWQFVKSCGHLDLNSPYYYYMMCRDFAETSMIAEQDGRIVAFCSGYRRPDDEHTLFIWQIGLSEQLRGMGMGKKLLSTLIDRLAPQKVQYLEATIAPENKAAEGLFTAVAREYGAALDKSTFLTPADFPEPHASEILLRIGPLERNHN